MDTPQSLWQSSDFIMWLLAILVDTAPVGTNLVIYELKYMLAINCQALLFYKYNTKYEIQYLQDWNPVHDWNPVNSWVEINAINNLFMQHNFG